MDFKETLQGVRPNDYGDLHRSHVLELYRIYVEMADRVSARRVTTNSFFLSINTAMIGLVGYISASTKTITALDVRFPIAISGIVICYLWRRIVRSYRDLNSAKFKVIHEIERILPLRPYDAEWEAVGRGKDPKRYLPFTHVEIAVPWVFIALHVSVVLFTLLVRTPRQ